MPVPPRYRKARFAFAVLLLVAATTSAAVPLRVACFNVENGLYPTNTPSYQDTEVILSRIGADVVGLCELMEWRNVNGVWNYVGDQSNFPTLANELGLAYRVFDTNNTPHRSGIASRYPITQTVWVNGAGMTRRIPLVRVSVPGAAKPVWVAMLHLKARHDSDLDQHKRAAELFHLRQAILTRCDVQNDAIIVMGDFNMVSPTNLVFTTPLYSGVTYPLAAPKDADGYFVPEQIFKLDARHAGPNGETYTWRGDNQFSPSALDHIMVNGPLRTLGVASEIYDIRKDGAGIDGLPKYGARPPPNSSYGSDHLPIFADLQLADAPPAQFRVLPGEDFRPVVRLGGEFGAVQKIYTVANDKMTSLQWFVWKSADWFDVTPGEGGISVAGQTSVTVSLNARAASLPAGEHTAEILFTDSITGSVVTRTVSLRVMDQKLQIDAPTTVTSTFADTYRYEGAMDGVLVNGLTWSNRANGLTGTIAYSPRWSADIPLVRGSNVVDFRGVYSVTNAPTTLVEVQATAPAVIREVNPAVFTGPAEGRQFVAGSEIYVNAQLGANTVGMELVFNGVVTEWTKSFGDAYAVKVGIPGPGVVTTVGAVARDADGFSAPQVERQYTGGAMLNPLPQVSMLPSPGGGPIRVGDFMVLRAQASFSNTTFGDPAVEFYANGVHIGAGRHTSGGVYELVWRTPVEVIDAKITAQATQADHLDPQTGVTFYAASISSNDARVQTVLMDDVTLAAGRTKYEVVAKKLTWPEAYADAVASGGRLAVFPYMGAYDKVIAQVRSRYSDALWLGLTDQDEEGVWRWIDGTFLYYGPWNAGEPNDWNGNEDYAHVWWGTTAWNDNGGVIPAYLLEKAPLELSSLPVSSGGWPWFYYWWSEGSADGKDMAVVTAGNDESSWREYTFTGPVKVRFQWKVSSGAGDTFSCAVNGETIKSISGETAWSTETIKLPAGTHTIRWTYSKDASGSAGWDAGLLDCLEFWNDASSPLGVKLGENAATFAVWAPNATAVSVVGSFNNWTETPLESDAATGHWTGTVPGAKHGDEYQYLIRWPGNESGRLKNDPRADWIRNGRSVVYDHSAFNWGAGFVPREDETGLVYELHIGAFNNTSPQTKTVATFDDAIQRLDYLQQLGVDIIALMPITEYETTTSWGYNPAYLFAVENDYGGPDALKRFVKAAHARGMKVQLDVVHNHYIQADYLAEGPGLLDFDGPEDIYFYGRNDPLSGDPDQPKRNATHWGPRPDFSQPEVRRYIEDNVRHWLDNYRIDGFRWDSPKNILGYDSDGKTAEPDTLLPEAKEMMAGINRMIHEQYPGRWSIAEEPGLLVAETPSSFPQFYRDAAALNLLEEFDGHWQYGFHDAVRNNLASPAPDVWGMLQRVMNISEKPATRVVFTDSHDLAGDLNKGLRWPHRVGEADPDSKTARKKSLLGAVLALTAPGSPMLLMGQEFNATGAFGDRIPLDWSKAASNHRLFRAYRDLVDLRRDFASVRSTALSSNFGANNGLRAGRYWRGSDVIVVLNISSQPLTNGRFYFPAGGQWFVRINTDSTIYGQDFGDFGPAGGVVNVTDPDNGAVVPVAPYSAVVLTRTPPLPAAEDADGDGLADSWETITGATDPGADDDADGLTNLREYLSGLDPKVFNPDAVVGSFNNWSPTANPLTVTAGNPTQRGHLRFLRTPQSGQFRWLLAGIYYGGTPGTPDLVEGGAPIAYQAPAGTYVYFSASVDPASAAATVIDPANPLDTDNNQLDDRWQTFYGVNDPNGDADVDTMSNLREFLRGTDPLVAGTPAVVGDRLPLAWTPDAQDLQMTWSEKRQRWEWVGVLAPGPVEFKFAMGPGWLGENHGRGNLPGTTDTAGGTDKNIVADLVVSGRHRFSFNELTRTYSLEFFPPRQEWRERHSLPADGSWTDDSDGDGMNDLLEYALGGNPRLGGAQSLGPAPRAPLESAQARSTGREMIFSWIQTNDPAVVVMPQVRADLTTGVWTDAVSEIDPDQTNVTANHVRKMVRVPGSSGRHFLRLNVSLP